MAAETASSDALRTEYEDAVGEVRRIAAAVRAYQATDSTSMVAVAANRSHALNGGRRRRHDRDTHLEALIASQLEAPAARDGFRSYLVATQPEGGRHIWAMVASVAATSANRATSLSVVAKSDGADTS